ncbi:Kelch repeat-containing protein [Oceanicaulis sp. LC35]|uniref:Kelch repeat-containing protein n=1 Tax=Oceanicaulis sp. LC35 TaxID=3349635 RepID=UPI003F858CD1
MLSRRETFTGIGAGALALTLAGRGMAQESPEALWRDGPDLPMRVQEIYPAVLDDVIYVAGGLSPDVGGGRIGVSDRVFSLAPDAVSWRERPRLPVPLHHPNLVGLEGLVYAVGGFTAQTGGLWAMSEGVRVFDPDRNRWRNGPAMPQPYAETVAVAINGRLHVVTGRRPAGLSNKAWGDHADTNAHIVLDPAAQVWTTAAPAPTARNSAAGAELNGRLHVVGGRTVSGGNTPAHEAYDPQSDSWEVRAPLPQPEAGPRGAGGLACASVEGALYVFGGEWFDNSGGGVYAQVWRYDPQSDSWSDMGRMPTPRHGLGAVTVRNVIATIAGAAQPSGNQTTAKLDWFTP